MDRSLAWRWSIILSALALTVVAIAYPVGDPISDVADIARPPIGTPAITGTDRITTAVSDGLQPQWIASNEDPFAPRGWEAPPPPTPPENVQRDVAHVVIAVAPPPPVPLPFQFLGQMSDDGVRVIYLKAGEQVLLAREGETLDGGYKVLGITSAQIEFESMGSGLRQTLQIPQQDN